MNSLPSGIRGNVVAADAVLEALLTHPEPGDGFTLFVHPWKEKLLKLKLATLGLTEEHNSKVQVRPLNRLGHKAQREFLTSLLAPLTGNSDTESGDTIYKLRDHYLDSPCPMLILSHGLSQHSLLYDFFFRFLTERSYVFDSLICTSAASRRTARLVLDDLQKHAAGLHYAGRIDRIPLCVNTDVFRPREDKAELRRAFEFPEDAVVLLYLGRLSMMKSDLRPVLKVLSALVHEGAQSEVLLVLAGTEDSGVSLHLVEYASSLGIKDNVRILLNISNQAKRRLIPSADIFVSLVDTLEESFGLAPIEAMACGVPQVVSNWSGYRDTVVHGETGYLVPTYWMNCTDDLAATGSILGAVHDHAVMGQSIAIDLAELYAYLKELIGNRDLRQRLGNQSRERALREFSYANVARLYRELMQDVSDCSTKFKERQSRRGNVTEAKYFSYFSHYASRLLDEKDRVRIQKSSIRGTVPAEMDALPGPLRVFDEINRTAIAGMLDLLQGEESESMSIDFLLFEASKRWDLGRELATRHVLWLLKHGYVQIANGSE
jgi:glycosyltransferase involved in cell wall biosynthesis